jgi:hypothetical protein
VVDVLEAYIRCDYDKRGSSVVAQGHRRRRGRRFGPAVNEEADDHPFVRGRRFPAAQAGRAVDPRPDPRHSDDENGAHPRGQQRQLPANRPMREVVEGQVNIEDI